MVIDNEKNIIKKVKKGDQLAFKVLYDDYADYALRATYYITGNHNHASDIVQETFVRVYRNIDQYDVKKPFKSWFYKILLNESKRYMKKQNAQAIPIESEELLDHFDSHHYNKQEDDEVVKALDELSEMHRTVLTLKYINGFKEREISKLLELNINTVKSRLYKARQKLKVVMGGDVYEE